MDRCFVTLTTDMPQLLRLLPYLAWLLLLLCTLALIYWSEPKQDSPLLLSQDPNYLSIATNMSASVMEDETIGDTTTPSGKLG